MRLVALVVAACSGGAMPETPSPHPHAGDRHGLHGMVLFGRSHHYLEHIPMFRRPHDKQLVLRVSLRDVQGKPIEHDFSATAHSLKPTTELSLDDLAHRKLATFTGDIHRGNFEADAPVVMRGVRITVDDVLVARDLPGSEPIAAGEQEYLLVGEPGDAYLTNYIRESRGFQQILRVDALAGITPSRSRVQRLVVRSPDRLAAGSVESQHGTVTIAAELWCLEAPEFVAACR